MANALQLRRGTTAQHSSFTGLAGEVTVDTDKDTVVVHDGSTAGGIPLAKEATLSSYATTASLANVATSGAYSDLSGTPSASDLLTSIKTVDGAGSGLDADTLDGKQLATLESEYQSYADTAVSNLVASAPATLDTLNELAAALGDDPNFATTVTNSIATKMPLAGGTFTGNVTVTSAQLLINNNDATQTFFNYGPNQNYIRGEHTYFNTTVSHSENVQYLDSVKATFGASNDLQIYHDGSNSYISDQGTGDLNIQSGASLRLQNSGGTQNYLYAADGGMVHLSYNGSVKVETTNTGADITGTLTTDGVTVDGTLDIEEVYEKVVLDGGTSGTINFDTTTQGIAYFVNNQTANRTINFSNVNSNLATGQSVTCTLLMDQGSTAYYLNVYQVDGSTVSVRWAGGSAPTGGNASGIDAYTFTIIKTANATFTVLASQTQFA